MKKTGLYFKLLLVLLITAGAIYLVLPQGSKISLKPLGIDYERAVNLKLGLDLQGGTQLIYEGQLGDIPEDARGEAMDAVRDVIERRVNAFGVSEPVVQVSGENRLIVELPGVKDINEAIDLIGQTPFLEFREENPNPDVGVPDAEGNLILDANNLFIPTGLTGAQFRRAVLEFEPTTGVPQISLQFDSEGTRLFSEITSRNIGNRVAIFLDGEILSAPTVQTPITDGQAVITGQFTVVEARELVMRLNSGALPVPIALISQQNVGATLGQESIEKSIAAGIIGFLILGLFMLIYYRYPGFIAVIALVVYGFIVAAIFKLLGVTLTLAGIAGFILSIGMAVDANILIFERLKEELRRGKNLRQAMEEGFARAWLSIRDSNFSTLITTFILAYFGTSVVRGFAITLALGVVISMFTAIVVTRTLMRLIAAHNIVTSLPMYGVARKQEEKNND